METFNVTIDYMEQVQTLFQVANNSVLVGWILLLALPHARITKSLVHSGFFSGALSALYLALIVGHFQLTDLGKFSSLAGILELFQNPAVLLAGWVHFLAFDLWVGAWIVRKGKEVNISHFILLPILLLTFLLGPIGFLLFLLVQKGKKYGTPK
jgi:hypothetical protein